MLFLRKKWSQFWFAPHGPTDLAVCRMLFFGILCYLCWGIDFAGLGELDAVFWMPILPFQLLGLPLLSATWLTGLAVVWKTSLLTSCLGLWTRGSTLMSWLLGCYLLGLLNCFGKMSHQHQLMVLIMGILALSRCGDAWSLDRLWQRWRGRGSVSRELWQSGIYTWPLRLTWAVFVLVFFAAGVAKLRYAGLAWAFSDNMANILIVAHYGTENTWNRLGLLVAQFGWLCQLMAFASLMLEVGCPLALFSRRTRFFWIGGLLMMQSGIFILMGTNFLLYLAGYVFWVPWSRVLAAARDRVWPRLQRAWLSRPGLEGRPAVAGAGPQESSGELPGLH